MSAVRGWCPDLFTPMPSGDGLLVRVKPPGARLSAEAARILADGATRHGNGVIELTNRANIQVRGLSANSAGPFAAEMVAAGLAHPNPAAERVRNVIAPPMGSSRLATEIEAALPGTPNLHGLPDKFSILVDTGTPSMASVRADITVRATADGATIALDGCARAAPCPLRNVVAAVLLLATCFLQQTPPARRMRDADGAAFFAAAGLRADVPVSPASGAPCVVGPLESAFGFGLPFGQMQATLLNRLADLAECDGDGTLRITPWRAVLLPVVRQASIDGLVTDPADPRLSVIACPGLPACASATVATRADAAVLAREVGGPVVHLSGCSKGCAHPGPAPVTLVGVDGRYDLVLNGRASDTPVARGLTLRDAAARLRAMREPE
jgi:precorrin-3B synthase